MIRALTLVSKAQGISPGQRFRLEQWAPHLRARHGIDLDFVPFESPALSRTLYQPGRYAAKAALVLKDSLRRFAHVLRARRYDVVVLFREAGLVGPPVHEALLTRLGVPLVLDFDDAIWRLSGGGVNGVFSRLRFPGKTARLCSGAATVSVGNAYLADYARRFNSDVHVVPTTIELADYPAQEEPPAEAPFTVVWTGSHSTLAHLEGARAALEALARRRKLRLRIICDRPPARPFSGVDTEFVPWSAQAESSQVAAGHVGIMPLPDDEFARGKCALKALQCMAVGRPVVVSPVGANRDVVRPGENGYWAATDEEWVQALDGLAASREERARLGAAARLTVERGYSAVHGAALFAAAVRQALLRPTAHQ